MMRLGSCETATSVDKKPSRSDSMPSSNHSATDTTRPQKKTAKLRLSPLSPNHAATIEERSSDITPYRSTVMKPSPMLSRIICTAFVRSCTIFSRPMTTTKKRQKKKHAAFVVLESVAACTATTQIEAS